MRHVRFKLASKQHKEFVPIGTLVSVVAPPQYIGGRSLGNGPRGYSHSGQPSLSPWHVERA